MSHGSNLTKDKVFVPKEKQEQLRVEFNRPSFKLVLRREKGSECICCNSTLGVEYHHILPICLGGDNRLSNIYPVCNSCHKLIHGGRVNKMWRNDNKGGRKKKKPPKGYKEVLDRYFRCEIGKAECHVILKYNGNKLNDKWWYNEYKKECGIKKHRNNIDIINANGEMYANREAGYITYNDGTTMVFNTNIYMQTHQEYKQQQLSFI